MTQASYVLKFHDYKVAHYLDFGGQERGRRMPMAPSLRAAHVAFMARHGIKDLVFMRGMKLSKLNRLHVIGTGGAYPNVSAFGNDSPFYVAVRLEEIEEGYEDE